MHVCRVGITLLINRERGYCDNMTEGTHQPLITMSHVLQFSCQSHHSVLECCKGSNCFPSVTQFYRFQNDRLLPSAQVCRYHILQHRPQPHYETQDYTWKLDWTKYTGIIKIVKKVMQMLLSHALYYNSGYQSNKPG